MFCWKINNLQEAIIAVKKLFLNCIDSTITFNSEDDLIFLKNIKERTKIFKRKVDIPDEIETDLQTLKYIENNINDILRKFVSGKKFPIIMCSTSECTAFEGLMVYELNNNFEFENMQLYAEEYNIEYIKSLFDKYNAEVSFFNSKNYVPISFDEFKIIISKMNHISFVQKNKTRFILNNFELTIDLNFKEKE